VSVDKKGIRFTYSLNGSMYKVMNSFDCRGCTNPVTGTQCTSVDICVNANLKSVDKFCYLGDMLSVDGDADTAVEARIQTGWNKLRHLVLLFINMDIIIDSEREIIQQLCAKWYIAWK